MKIRHCGFAGHYIAADGCRFHLLTQIGALWRVSTVGEYHDVHGKRQTLGASPESWYETFVFHTKKTMEGMCGVCHAVADWSNVEGIRSASSARAIRVHEAMIAKYAVKKSRRRPSAGQCGVCGNYHRGAC